MKREMTTIEKIAKGYGMGDRGYVVVKADTDIVVGLYPTLNAARYWVPRILPSGSYTAVSIKTGSTHTIYV